MLRDFIKSNQKGEKTEKTFRIINELKTLRKKVIINHLKYLKY